MVDINKTKAKNTTKLSQIYKSKDYQIKIYINPKYILYMSFGS